MENALCGIGTAVEANQVATKLLIWAADREENIDVKVCHIDDHMPKKYTTEVHQNVEQEDKTAKIEIENRNCSSRPSLGR